MMNPMSRTYQGYSQANQSLVEEEGEGENENESDRNEDALEQGREIGRASCRERVFNWV